MSDLRSGPLAAWASAWLAGVVSIDQVVDAVQATDAPHTARAMASPDLVPLTELLVLWRREGGPVRMVLPAPGDVRGLPGPAEFRSAALEVGEAVVTGRYGAVPEVIDHAPSSAPTSVVWHSYIVDPTPVEHASLSDAQYELTTAIRESASALASADVARWREGLDESLRGARGAGEHLNLPPGHPPRAVALLAQAERMHNVLALALADPTGGAIDQYEMTARSSALRPLAAAVRRARVVGYNAQS